MLSLLLLCTPDAVVFWDKVQFKAVEFGHGQGFTLAFVSDCAGECECECDSDCDSDCDCDDAAITPAAKIAGVCEDWRS